MEIKTKIFYNKANGQASVTLPSKMLKQLESDLKLQKPLKKISLKIGGPNGFTDLKT
jgi:hypothetical protein